MANVLGASSLVKSRVTCPAAVAGVPAARARFQVLDRGELLPGEETHLHQLAAELVHELLYGSPGGDAACRMAQRQQEKPVHAHPRPGTLGHGEEHALFRPVGHTTSFAPPAVPLVGWT